MDIILWFLAEEKRKWSFRVRWTEVLYQWVSIFSSGSMMREWTTWSTFWFYFTALSFFVRLVGWTCTVKCFCKTRSASKIKILREKLIFKFYVVLVLGKVSCSHGRSMLLFWVPWYIYIGMYMICNTLSSFKWTYAYHIYDVVTKRTTAKLKWAFFC